MKVNSKGTVFVATGFVDGSSTFQWRYDLTVLRRDLRGDYRMKKARFYEIRVPKAVRSTWEGVQEYVEARELDDLYAGRIPRKESNT